MDKENKLILYKDEEGRVSVNTRFADEDVWLTQAQLVEIYQSSKSNISEHIKHIFEDKELDEAVVVRKFRTTTQHGAIEGKTQSRDVAHYNLDMIIALGYRVQSPIAVRFRRWALSHAETLFSHAECVVCSLMLCKLVYYLFVCILE